VEIGSLLSIASLARSTGAAINWGQKTATQHDCGAFGKDTFFLPQKRRRNEDQWAVVLGE